jgi:hypothetical protein
MRRQLTLFVVIGFLFTACTGGTEVSTPVREDLGNLIISDYGYATALSLGESGEGLWDDQRFQPDGNPLSDNGYTLNHNPCRAVNGQYYTDPDMAYWVDRILAEGETNHEGLLQLTTWVEFESGRSMEIILTLGFLGEVTPVQFPTMYGSDGWAYDTESTVYPQPLDVLIKSPEGIDQQLVDQGLLFALKDYAEAELSGVPTAVDYSLTDDGEYCVLQWPNGDRKVAYSFGEGGFSFTNYRDQETFFSKG